MSSAHRYLDVLDRVAEAHANAKSAQSAKSGPRTKAEAVQNSQNAQNSRAQGPASKRGSEQNPYGSTIAALEARCPDLVPVKRWQQAVQDGRRFLARWGEQARALGWTARDLFGLIAVPEHAKPSFNRLSRYDETGLIWLLQGRPVVALTEATAAIQSSTGAITICRRHNKPALGPVGDSLDDLEPPGGAIGAQRTRSND
jgi:hypothetical protein